MGGGVNISKWYTCSFIHGISCFPTTFKDIPSTTVLLNVEKFCIFYYKHLKMLRHQLCLQQINILLNSMSMICMYFWDMLKQCNAIFNCVSVGECLSPQALLGNSTS